MASGNRGGARQGAGRKPKAAEIELIEKLSPLEDIALKKLHDGVKSGDYNFIKLFMEYRYGKPKQQTDITTGGEPLNQPIIIKGEKFADKAGQ